MHWVRPELVAEVKYLTWTEDNLLRQVVYEGLREDKPAAEGPPRGAVPETFRTGKTGYSLKTDSSRLTGDAALARRTYFLAGCTISRPGKPGAVRPRFNLPARTIACSRRQRWSHITHGTALLSFFS